MKTTLVNTCLVVLLAVGSSSFAGVDDFEDTGPNFTVVQTRVIEGVTVTISNANGRSPKKLIGASSTPIWISRALIEPENGLNSVTHVKATAMMGET